VDSKPSKAEADRLIAVPKIASSAIRWKYSDVSARLETIVITPDQPEHFFRLLAYVSNEGSRNYSFVLLFHNHPIRKFTKHSPHKIAGVWVKEPHKHVWDGETENRQVYIPDDIDPINQTINEQFLAFCAECKIELVGEYQYLAF